MTVDNIAKSMGPDYSNILPTLVNNCKRYARSFLLLTLSLVDLLFLLLRVCDTNHRSIVS
jgi:hypothetical protein